MRVGFGGWPAMALCFYFLQGRMGIHSLQENWTLGLGMMLASCLYLYICFMCGIVEQFSMPIRKERKESERAGQRTIISQAARIPTLNVT